MQVGWVKIGHFQRKTRYNSKMVQDRLIVSIKVEWKILCALSNGDVSDDLGWPFTPKTPQTLNLNPANRVNICRSAHLHFTYVLNLILAGCCCTYKSRINLIWKICCVHYVYMCTQYVYITMHHPTWVHHYSTSGNSINPTKIWISKSYILFRQQVIHFLGEYLA